MIEGIHVIQQNMGIAGASAAEAATTLEGSFNMMSASWQNLLVAFGEGTPDAIKPAVDNLISSVGTWLSNAIPRIGLILSGIVSYIPTLAQDIISALPGMVSDISAAFVEQVGSIDLGAMLQPVIDAAMENSLVASIVSFGGRIGAAFTQVFGEVDLAATFDTIRVAVETAMGVITQVITAAQDTLASFLGSIDTATIVSVMEGLKQIGETLIGVLVTIGSTVADVLVGLVWPTLQGIWSFVSGIILPGVMSLWETIQPGILMVIGMLGQVYDWISQLVSGLIEFLVPAIALILEIAAPVIQGLMDGIGEILGTLISSIGAMWDTIAPFVSRVVADLSAFFSELGKWIRAVWPVVSWVANQIGQIIAIVVRTVTSMVSGLISGIGNIIKGIIGVVTGIASTIYDLITGNFDALQSDFSGLVSSIGSIFWGVIEIITSPFRYAFSQIRSLWNSTVGSLHFSVPDWVPGIGGKSFGMPQLASGGTIMQAGSVMVGEAGPEILTLPRGARVTPLRDADTSAGATYSVIVGDVDLTDDDQVRRVTREYLAFLATLAKPTGIVAV
jgi:phage-related protein